MGDDQQIIAGIVGKERHQEGLLRRGDKFTGHVGCPFQAEVELCNPNSNVSRRDSRQNAAHSNPAFFSSAAVEIIRPQFRPH